MPANLMQLEDVFRSVVGSLLILVGIASIVMILYGGIQMLMAGADKEAAGRARMTLTYAVLGLVVSFSAWMILALFGQFLGVPVGFFRLNFS